MPMRFKQLILWEVHFPLHFRFAHAKHTHRNCPTIIAELTTEHGQKGYGQALPRSYVTGETIATVWDTLVEIFWPTLKKMDFPVASLPWDEIFPLYAQADQRRLLAAYAALDIAVFNAWSQASGVALEKAL